MPLKDWSTTDADNDDADLSNNIRWTENQAPSTVNNSARAMMTQIKRFWDEIDGGTISNATVGGTADVITLTSDQGVSAYAAGQRYLFVAGGTNTTAVTVNVDSLGAKAVKSHGDPLAAGAIASGDIVIIAYDGTDFELVYPRRHISVPLKLVDDTDDANEGPTLTLYRNRGTPADSDLTGVLAFSGEDSAGNEEVIAKLIAKWIDVTSTTEDAELLFYRVIAGTLGIGLHLGAGLYTPNATGTDKGADTANFTDYYRDGVIVGGTLIALVQDQKTSGTGGGSFTSGGDRTRELNTEVFDLANVVAVGSNQITLDAGDYIVEWSAPANRVENNQSFLYDVTGTAVVERGTSEYADSVTQNESEPIEGTTRSWGMARVTPGSSNVYEVRHRCSRSETTNGFGLPGSFGTEVYTWVKIYAV